MKHALRNGAVMAAAALTLSLTLSPAQADPKFVPDHNDLVGVGSDTTEFVMQALAGKFNSLQVGGTRRLASWNATGSDTIVPRKNAASITRPDGSSAGISVLLTDKAITFARSSRGPNPTGDTGTLFYPYAIDKLGYVYSKPGSHVYHNLTAAQLKSIYTCNDTNWSDFGRPAGEIQAKVPQSGSGTRTFFLASIGETEQQLQDAIAEPDNVCSVTEVQEHDPNAVIGDPNAIAPFSYARYKILDSSTKTEIQYAVNAPFNVTRDVYNVIRTADESGLDQYFNPDSWICTSSAANTIIVNQGFTRLPSNQCGQAVPAP